MTIEADLKSIAVAIKQPAFKKEQDTFFDKYVNEFDEGDENKLIYTTIHNEYQELVEGLLTKEVGEELLVRVCEGMEAFIEASKESAPSQDIVEAIDIMSSMGEFLAFKGTMVYKRKEKMNAAAASLNIDGKKVPVIDLDGVMGTLGDLQGAQGDEGWDRVAHDAVLQIVLDMKKSDKEDARYARYRIALDMPVDQARDCFGPDVPIETSKEWTLSEYVKDFSLVRENAPCDWVFRMEFSFPWIIRYLMSMPQEMHLRVKMRLDFPSPGDISWVEAPYDIKTNSCLESQGVMRVRAWVMHSDPSDDKKTILTMMEKHPGKGSWLMPDAQLINTVAWPQQNCRKFKKSGFFKQKYGEDGQG
uniref:ADP-ribosylation factor-like protein 2-binding protein n=1 Tax=Hemiselmis tepida TaxID=464990 RepID=A0A7S0VZN7_9CRYP|mmetsp:Transcript_3456/g.8885  ORF Transcript_3456/g.8885 Transcript_3456/m.8885 type:complete len:360 (+) Transcript_3456:100-1179(+)|eukprot:CAMPEP_0174921664 /NCGR_PEP_ID=MMETSP1355-20121228/5314_1 /TAXON_ID=464990 /ORGANISM="Hemiselmis tepida, Strain CCMP443" /LENGTH=359 /DNA_ID=CAMNT_0016167177 /DNA_START=224 /DNA_END=1303 /DNA_ORIENTATION=+